MFVNLYQCVVACGVRTGGPKRAECARRLTSIGRIRLKYADCKAPYSLYITLINKWQTRVHKMIKVSLHVPAFGQFKIVAHLPIRTYLSTHISMVSVM